RAVGRGGPLLLRPAAPARRRRADAEAAVDGRPGADLRGRGAGAGTAGAAAGLPPPDEVVFTLPARPGCAGVALGRAGQGPPPTAVAAARQPAEGAVAAAAGRDGVPQRARAAHPVARLQGSALRPGLRRATPERRLPGGRV